MGFELAADPLLLKVVDWQNRVVRDLVEAPYERADTLGRALISSANVPRGREDIGPRSTHCLLLTEAV